MDVFLEDVFSPGDNHTWVSRVLCFHLCLINYIRHNIFFFSITVSHCSSEVELGHKTRSGTKISFVSPAVIYSSAISAKPTVIILKRM